MRIVEINALANGAHNNQTINGILRNIPEGYAVIPEGMECKNFPFGEVKTEEVNGVMMVTVWTPGEIPTTDPEAKEE